MNNEDFQKFVVEKLISIEQRLTTLEEARRSEIRLIKLLTTIICLILAKLGIDVSGILG